MTFKIGENPKRLAPDVATTVTSPARPPRQFVPGYSGHMRGTRELSAEFARGQTPRTAVAAARGEGQTTARRAASPQTSRPSSMSDSGWGRDRSTCYLPMSQGHQVADAYDRRPAAPPQFMNSYRKVVNGVVPGYSGHMPNARDKYGGTCCGGTSAGGPQSMQANSFDPAAMPAPLPAPQATERKRPTSVQPAPGRSASWPPIGAASLPNPM